MLDIIEQNIILYYADYLALRNASRQVTDNCKYYCLCGAPVNIAYLHDSRPFYDTEDPYYVQAYTELQTILQKTGIDAVKEFVMNICNLKVMGCVDAKLMLKQIHQFSNLLERNVAFSDYQKWLNTQHYSHLHLNEKLELERTECSRYIAHADFETEYEPQVEYIKINRRDRIVEKSIQSYSGTRIEIKKL